MSLTRCLPTGGSAAAAITMLKEKGVKKIHFLCIIAAPEGVKKLAEEHPDIDIFIGALDDHLNSHKYIVPGLGDAGDRIFGRNRGQVREWAKNDRYYSKLSEYFMGVAKLAALRSKDPNSQVGSCIVSSDNKILSMGYNGFPMGCSDDEFPWGREGEPLETKYVYVTHSELNAILNYRGGQP